MAGKRLFRIKDTGLGYKVKKGAQPIINKDGSANVVYKNIPVSIDNLYAYLIDISWTKFFLSVGLGYILMNTLFALLYLLIGIEQLGLDSVSLFSDFTNTFYFSAQTITTVGYGAISPNGMMSGLLSSFEALIGLLSFSFITGLLYGRFSKPKASVSFSVQMIIRPFEDGKAIMFRLMNKRSSLMIEPEVSATISKVNKKGDKLKREFFQMPLTLSKIHYLPAMWTLVHKIEEGTAFYGLSDKEISESKAEFYIMLKYFDEAYKQQVYQLHHYDIDELEHNVQFDSSYIFDEQGFMEVDYDSLSTTFPMSESNSE
jgi:inward rectifier potassium channel